MDIINTTIDYIQTNYTVIFWGAVTTILYIVLAQILISIYKKLVARLLKLNKGDKRKTTISKVFISIGRYVIWFIFIVIILDSFGVDTKAILGSAAVLGLAFGLGAQKLVADFISGFFIIFEDSFSIGDIVKIEGFKGEVIDIGLRTTKIKDWTGTLKIINNGDIQTVENFSKYNSIGIIDFGVAYETDLDKMEEIINEFIKNKKYTHPSMLKDPVYLGVISMNASDIGCRIIVETEPMSHFQIERDLRNELKKLFEENGIEIPFPQIVVSNK